MEPVGYDMGAVHNKAFYWVSWQQSKGSIIVDDVSEAFKFTSSRYVFAVGCLSRQVPASEQLESLLRG